MQENLFQLWRPLVAQRPLFDVFEKGRAFRACKTWGSQPLSHQFPRPMRACGELPCRTIHENQGRNLCWKRRGVLQGDRGPPRVTDDGITGETKLMYDGCIVCENGGKIIACLRLLALAMPTLVKGDDRVAMRAKPRGHQIPDVQRRSQPMQQKQCFFPLFG